jgi:hypothetical protein
VGEEVEALEDHADLGTQLGQRLALCGQRRAVQGDRALVDRLEPVDRAAQRRLARSGRADDHDHLALGDSQLDVLEGVQRPEVLLHTAQDDKWLTSTRSAGFMLQRGHARNL